MYKIVKFIDDGMDVYIVLHDATGKEVFRADTYDQAYRFVLSQ
jgi:hypothetical protein